MPGPQPGIGRAATVADCRLNVTCDVDEEKEAAAAPARTTANAKILTASFIIGYSYAEIVYLKGYLLTPTW
jgi:hypothetical protein